MIAKNEEITRKRAKLEEMKEVILKAIQEYNTNQTYFQEFDHFKARENHMKVQEQKLAKDKASSEFRAPRVIPKIFFEKHISPAKRVTSSVMEIQEEIPPRTLNYVITHENIALQFNLNTFEMMTPDVFTQIASVDQQNHVAKVREAKFKNSTFFNSSLIVFVVREIEQKYTESSFMIGLRLFSALSGIQFSSILAVLTKFAPLTNRFRSLMSTSPSEFLHKSNLKNYTNYYCTHCNRYGCMTHIWDDSTEKELPDHQELHLKFRSKNLINALNNPSDFFQSLPFPSKKLAACPEKKSLQCYYKSPLTSGQLTNVKKLDVYELEFLSFLTRMNIYTPCLGSLCIGGRFCNELGALWRQTSPEVKNTLENATNFFGSEMSLHMKVPVRQDQSMKKQNRGKSSSRPVTNGKQQYLEDYFLCNHIGECQGNYRCECTFCTPYCQCNQLF